VAKIIGAAKKRRPVRRLVLLLAAHAEIQIRRGFSDGDFCGQFECRQWPYFFASQRPAWMQAIDKNMRGMLTQCPSGNAVARKKRLSFFPLSSICTPSFFVFLLGKLKHAAKGCQTAFSGAEVENVATL
jgi:hypothetical protein